MKKFTCYLLCFMLLTPTFLVFADEPSEPAVVEIRREVVVLSYDQALEFILGEVLPIQDLDTFIRDMQIQYRELRYQIRQMERGEVRQDNIRILLEQLSELEMMMWQAQMGHEAVNMQVQQSMNAIFAGATSPEAAAGMGMHLNLASMGMAQGAGIAQQMGTMEQQRAMLFAELQNLNDDNLFRDMLDEMRRGLDELERQVDGLHMNQAMVETVWESVLRSLIIAIEEIELGLQTMEANLELAEMNLTRMTVSYEVGMISSHDLRAMEHGVNQLRVQISELQRSQDSVRQNLNHLMGLPLNQLTVIEFSRELPTMPENLDTHIAYLIANDSSILQAQFDIDRAKAERRAYTGNDRDLRITDNERRRAQNAINPLRTDADERRNEQIRVARNRVNLQDAVERAILGKEQEMRNLESSVRRAYSDLEALFVQEESQGRELEQAQAALTVAEANFDAGRITRFDVEQARLNVATVEQGIESIHNQMWILSFQLSNPSLLAD